MMLRVPETSRAPVQAPDAIQLVVWEDVHVRVAVPPAMIVGALSVRLAAGWPYTIRFAFALTVPPLGPMQVMP